MAWIPNASYFGILLALLAAGFGVPIPEDIPLLTAGYLCHLGTASLPLMLPLTLAGVLGCDVILYHMGRRLGDRVIEHRWIRRLYRPATLVKAKSQFRRHGAKIIFAGRFMPGARAVIFVSAGIVGVSWWKFMLVDGLAALISVPTLVFLGWFFGEKSQSLLAQVRHAEYYIAGGIAVVTIAAITIESYMGRRRRAREAAECGMEPLGDVERRVDEGTRAARGPGSSEAAASDSPCATADPPSPTR